MQLFTISAASSSMRLRHSIGIILISLDELLALGHGQHGSSSPQRYEGRLGGRDSFGIGFVLPQTLANRLQLASRYPRPDPCTPITELEKSPQKFNLAHPDGNNHGKSSPSRRTTRKAFYVAAVPFGTGHHNHRRIQVAWSMIEMAHSSAVG